MLKRWLASSVLAGALTGAAMLSAAASDAQTIVTQVNGGARSAQRQLALLDRLGAGDSVAIDAGSTLVLFRMTQGEQFTLTGPGHFTLGAAGPERQSGSGSTRMERPPSALGRVLQRHDQVVAGAIVRAALTGNEVERVAPSRPLFSWRARPHQGQWRFRLTDEGGQVLFETTLAATELSLPPAIRLLPGRLYVRELHWPDRDGSMRVEALPVQALDAADDAELSALYPVPDADQPARVLYALYLRGLGVRALATRVAPEIEPNHSL